MSSLAVRDRLVAALATDLVGPATPDEVLREPPSRFYLTGFLVPVDAPVSQRADVDASDTPDAPAAPAPGGDDDAATDPPAARTSPFPSSAGLSVLVPAGTAALEVTAAWGDYVRTGGAGVDDPDEPEPEPEAPQPEPTDPPRRPEPLRWRRTPHAFTTTIPLSPGRPTTTSIPDSDGLQIVCVVREVTAARLVPAGTRAVSLFLVNRRTPRPDVARDASFVFQAELHVRCAGGFVPRPDLRGLDSDDWDDQVAELQHHDVFEWATGHNVSVSASATGGACAEVRTAWVPDALVEKVDPAAILGAELRMEALDAAEGAATLQALLAPIPERYQAWLEARASEPLADPRRADTARRMLRNAERARARIAAGIAALDRDDVRLAFRLANRAMAMAARQRLGADVAPEWRPFQLAFLLMNLPGLAGADPAERETVDLLFFPTGGGKTEAYLGLAAFTLVLRRLRHPGLGGAGVSVLMRYTLRLLTLDQLGRAATLICALELLRQQDVEALGTWPFEIGLWVGSAATPNIMGRKGKGSGGDDYTARGKTLRFQRDPKRFPSPIPLENCPWCGARLDSRSFRLLPDPDQPTNLVIACIARGCAFSRNNPLPILAVDEPIYRRLPCFVVATVDKFASLPWVGRTGALFGKVERADAEGFYGPCDPGLGKPLGGPLPPPDLVVQDELHLISGPLGTMVGLYETAIDALSAAGDVRPKIVASTATVRRADKQIRALFGRRHVEVFPPLPDRRHSFFARTVPAADKPARRYVGVAAPGRSLKVVLLRTYLALLGAAQAAYDAHAAAVPNPADPYMTLVGYFNSLRELGGSRRIVEDEVTHRLRAYDRRRREGDPARPFAARDLYEPQELTSRVKTHEVAETKRRLALSHVEAQHVDVVLATNMISVGLDITRLGLMVVLGQPKTTAEYIQATSRVGRDDRRPGLVVTLLNVHRPRDRSHYEHFTAWHQSFYRAVEATSVTPFSPRALDRGLPAVVVAMGRLGAARMTPSAAAMDVSAHRTVVDRVAELLAERAQAHDRDLEPAEQEALRQRVRMASLELLDAWDRSAVEQIGSGLQYAPKEGGTAPPLLYEPLDPERLRQSRSRQRFKAPRSLRDVEPTVPLWVRTPGDRLIKEEE